MVVLLYGAHAAARKPLVETLLDGRAPSDPEAPCVRVCFEPHELLDAPVGARVVLVGAARAAEWLNIHRPVVWERELVLLLWVEDDALEHLRRNAPDFLDWVSHRIEVPWFAPEGAAAELQLALTRVKWIAVAGEELVVVASKDRQELEAHSRYEDISSAMAVGDVFIHGLEHDEDLWRLMIAHAEARWSHHVVLAAPRVLPPFTWVIDARIEPWERGARQLESLGVEHARLHAALGPPVERTPRPPLAAGLAQDEGHMELLGRVAREQFDGTTVRLARRLGLTDVAEALAMVAWINGPITPELVERGMTGGIREAMTLGRYSAKLVGDELRDETDPAIVERALLGLLGDDGQVLRAWDPAREPSFEAYLRRMIRRLAFADEVAAEAAPSSSDPRKPSP